jgi:hypothetical protein
VTKQLFVLAAWAVFATGMMGLAGSWHTKSYIVAQPAATPERVARIVHATDAVRGSRVRSQPAQAPPRLGRKSLVRSGGVANASRHA